MILLLMSLASTGLLREARAMSFGSYGRVQASGDLRGGAGDPVTLVTWGSRLEKPPYLELDFGYDAPSSEFLDFSAVITPAIQGELFAYSGSWDADLALRNAYAVASRHGLELWAGARMWRGDDVYLFDLWPLDDLNVVGAGASYTQGNLELAGVVGAWRLWSGDWFVQDVPIPVEGGVGEEMVRVLDRQRVGGALRLVIAAGGPVSLRARLYLEGAVLPEGTRQIEEQLTERLPADRGGAMGAQLTVSGAHEGSFAHLWYRFGGGLCAWDELDLADGLTLDGTTQGAIEHRFALAGNREYGRAGVLFGAWARRFADADANDVDFDDRWEGALAVRPAVYPWGPLVVAGELSHEWIVTDGLNPRTDTHDVPQITKLALLPGVQPAAGSFSRPQIRLQYIYSRLNDSARLWYPLEDARHQSNNQHYLGVGAEWWLGASHYR